MRKKYISILVVLLLVLMMPIITQCTSEDENEEARRIVENMRLGMVICEDKYRFAHDLHFNVRFIGEGELRYGSAQWLNRFVEPRFASFDPNLNELVFVRNESESEGFPDNVIVAWPNVGFNGVFMQEVINGFHNAIDRDETKLTETNWIRRGTVLTLEEFGLSYPLTVGDFVDNWEQVNSLLRALDLNEEEQIIRVAMYLNGQAREAAEADSDGVTVDEHVDE